MNTDAISFALLVLDVLLLISGIVALCASRIHDDEVRMVVLASLPVVGGAVAAVYRWCIR